MFTSMCGFAFISGAPTTNYPVDNYLSFEGECEFSSSIITHLWDFISL